MYPLFETIRVTNGCPENLDYHEERRFKALDELFNKAPKLSLEDIFTDMPFPDTKSKLFKVVVEYDATDYDTSVYSYNPKRIKTLRMVESNVNYPYKWTNREELTKLLSDDVHEDVIIVKNGWVTDASFANLAFQKEGKWYTPQHCLLRGTMRQYLLDERKIEEIPIHSDEIMQFSKVRLINAMLRFSACPVPISQVIPLP